MRVKRGFKRARRRKRLLQHAKGYFLSKHNLYNIARQAVHRALNFAYTGRKVRKRDFRGIWIVRIGAAARQNGLSYSRLMDGLRKASVALDRKLLANLAATDPQAFARVAEVAKGASAR
jgi:large subunit ribosomal protein L20